MKWAPIVPVSLLPTIPDEYHLIIATLLRDNEGYREYYRKARGWKILDNGAYEGELMPAEELLDWADCIGANEVVCPDIIGECEPTIQLMEDFFPLVKHRFKVMVPLQFKTWQEFERILTMSIVMGAYSLAIPRAITKTFGPFGRLGTIEKIRKRFIPHPLHAFGCTDETREVQYLAAQKQLRGIDTSAPFLQALAELELDDPPAPRPPDYFDLDNLTVDQYGRCKERAREFGYWCETTSPTSPMRDLRPK